MDTQTPRLCASVGAPLSSNDAVTDGSLEAVRRIVFPAGHSRRRRKLDGAYSGWESAFIPVLLHPDASWVTAVQFSCRPPPARASSASTNVRTVSLLSTSLGVVFFIVRPGANGMPPTTKRFTVVAGTSCCQFCNAAAPASNSCWLYAQRTEKSQGNCAVKLPVASSNFNGRHRSSSSMGGEDGSAGNSQRETSPVKLRVTR